MFKTRKTLTNIVRMKMFLMSVNLVFVIRKVLLIVFSFYIILDKRY